MLIAPERDSTTSKRLEAELRSLGLTVITTPMTATDASRAQLEQIARNQNAFAAVRVIARGVGAELWIADRVTNKTVLREIATGGESTDSSDDSIAVGVAELLRASLMEVNAQSRPRGEVPPTPKIRELARVPHAPVAKMSTFWIAIGPGAELGLRGVGASLAGQASAGWQSPAGWGAEIVGGATLADAAMERAEGKASISSQWVALAGTLGWEAREANVSARAGLGVMAARIRAQGETAAAPLTAVTDSAWSAGPYLHGGPAVGFSSLRVRLDVGALVLLNAPKIRFADDPVAVWGEPALFLSLGVETFGTK
ncbi:MAG: hypothetical protein ABW133_12720 [Polyangiaceae bacterium]